MSFLLTKNTVHTLFRENKWLESLHRLAFFRKPKKNLFK